MSNKNIKTITKYHFDDIKSDWGGLFMIAEKIKELRINGNLTQSDIAKKLGVTRSCVNAWEMGISVPSTQYIVLLSEFFDVSSDFLLGISKTSTINVSGLSEREIIAVHEIVKCLKDKQIKS